MEIIFGFNLLSIKGKTAWIRRWSEIPKAIEPTIFDVKLGLAIMRSIRQMELAVILVGCLIMFE